MKPGLLLISCLFFLNSFSQNLSFLLEGYVTETHSKKSIQGATVKLVGSDNTVLETKTDSTGYYFFSSTAVKPNTSYVVSASAMDVKMPGFPNGFLGNPKAKITTRGETASKRFRQDFQLNKLLGCTMRMPIMTFKKNSDAILPTSSGELDILIKVLTENPNLVVELSSHSSYDEKDPKGISFKRAQKVVDALTSKGIDANRLIPKAYGDIKPFVTQGDSTAPSGQVIPGQTSLSKEWIKTNLAQPADQEYAARLNSRVTFSILRRDYVPAAEGK